MLRKPVGNQHTDEHSQKLPGYILNWKENMQMNLWGFGLYHCVDGERHDESGDEEIGNR